MATDPREIITKPCKSTTNKSGEEKRREILAKNLIFLEKFLFNTIPKLARKEKPKKAE
jgi:hypothetical protein